MKDEEIKKEGVYIESIRVDKEPTTGRIRHIEINIEMDDKWYKMIGDGETIGMSDNTSELDIPIKILIHKKR